MEPTQKELKKMAFINPSTISNFSLRAAAIISIDGRFLLVKNEGKDKFKLPGGHLTSDESFRDGLKRELSEELGLELGIPDSPDFFDQLIVDDLIVVTAYFNLGDVNLSFEELKGSAKLPVKLFSANELSEDNTFASEIGAVRKTL